MKKKSLLALALACCMSFMIGCGDDDEGVAGGNGGGDSASVENTMYAPTLSSDGKTITYGFYPQSVVTDDTLEGALTALNPNGWSAWVDYEGDTYGYISNPELIDLEDGTKACRSYYKYEPIVWDVLKQNADGSYLVISQKILDWCQWSNGSADTYAESKLRTQLNESFYNKAFKKHSNAIVANADGDKVFALSNAEMGDTAYFAEDAARVSVTTPFVRARGLDYNETTFAGEYWTSTPQSSMWIYFVGETGYLPNNQYQLQSTDGAGYRPAMNIKLG
jgi:hypothetical protein